MADARTEPYAMYTTMHRQPADVRMLLAEGWEGAGEAAALLADAARVFVVGIGTSFHAAQIGAYLLRNAGADARAVDSHEFATYPYSLRGNDAVIVMAHTGRKQYSGRAIELAKPQIFREGWLERVFAPEAVLQSVKDICDPPKAA